MPDFTKPFNRVFFLLCVLITGALAGAFVWLFFFLMDIGITFLWQTVPGWLGSLTVDVFPVLSRGPFGFIPYPLVVCIAGGVVIGLYAKHVKVEPEELTKVMAQVKETGRYDYGQLGRLSLAALLPLLFGGSVGPEAGLTGVIAGLCTWVGDRMRRFDPISVPLPWLAPKRRLRRCSPRPCTGLWRRFPAVPMVLTASRSNSPRLRKQWCTCAPSWARWAHFSYWASCSAAVAACRVSMRWKWAAMSLPCWCRLPWWVLHVVGFSMRRTKGQNAFRKLWAAVRCLRRFWWARY